LYGPLGMGSSAGHWPGWLHQSQQGVLANADADSDAVSRGQASVNSAMRENRILAAPSYPTRWLR
jgi:hypothetical protein